MINLEVGDLIPTDDLPEILPKRKGKPLSLKTIDRWCRIGAGPRLVKLETYKVGSMRVTSRDALRRFIAQLSEPNA